jgi:hypothetical protein
MKAKLPPGTRAEQVEYARNLMRQQQLETPTIRLTRTKRRVAVAGLYVVVAATLTMLVAFALNFVSGNKAMAVLWFLLGIQAIFFVVLTYSVGALNKGDSSLDERERSQRDHATAFAYKILAFVAAALTFAALVANTAFGWVPKADPTVGLSPFLMPFIWFVASLPMAVMGWTLPDPDPSPEG